MSVRVIFAILQHYSIHWPNYHRNDQYLIHHFCTKLYVQQIRNAKSVAFKHWLFVISDHTSLIYKSKRTGPRSESGHKAYKSAHTFINTGCSDANMMPKSQAEYDQAKESELLFAINNLSPFFTKNHSLSGDLICCILSEQWRVSWP